jgi:hypothetical protein
MGYAAFLAYGGELLALGGAVCQDWVCRVGPCY